MLDSSKKDEIFIEILRLGLISIRNLSHHLGEKRNRVLILEWSEMCHTIPTLIGGSLSQRAIKYFLDAQGKRFTEDYPDKEAAYYFEIVGLIEDLKALLTTE
jgi:hypothetical protein